jgi:hypothetical protein
MFDIPRSLLLCGTLLLLSACDFESTLPEATGKASIRAINAIPSSGEVNFLIEERSLGALGYKASSSTARYDNLNYTFNFDVFYTGEDSVRRIASRNIDFEVGKDYTLLLIGDLASPTLTLWEGEERTFNETDTVFEAKFAHLAESLGSVDYYLDDPAIAPVLGNQVATLSFGEVSAPIDFPEATYVLTITEAGNPDAVLFVSSSSLVGQRNALIFTVFDGDASDTAPVTVRAIAAQGTSSILPNPNFPATVQFINASRGLGTADIYDDEVLTNRIVADHGYLDVSDENSVAAGEASFYYTPAGDTAAIVLQTGFTAFDGARYRIVSTSVADTFNAVVSVPDRVPELTRAKLLPVNASNNFGFLDLYAVPAGESIDDFDATRPFLGPSEVVNSVGLAAGSYDIYITEFTEKVVLAGPYRVNVALGDVVDMIIVDTDDPAILDVLFLSGGPID